MEDQLFQELKQKEIEAIKKSGGFVSFAGDDNCEDCEGWDGEDSRCQCGNRRVSWAYEDGIGLYAEAY